MKVAVGVITDEQQRILITRRSLDAPHGGLWEFPGGKLEDAELPTDALTRELKEEVGLDVVAYHFLGEVCHAYERHSVSLLIYHVHQYQGEAVCKEAQMDLRWVDLSELGKFQFPAANDHIIEIIKGHVNCSKEPQLI